jgi:hypothetical protein
MRQLGLIGGGVALVLAGFAAPPAAAVPDASSVLECQYSLPGGIGSQIDSGTFGTSGSCSVPGSSGSLSSLPTLLLQVTANTSGLPVLDQSGVSTFGWIYYDFTVTGGAPGTPVPVLVETNMLTSGTSSTDPNNATLTQALIYAFRLNDSLQVVGNDGFINVCTDSPTGCTDPSSFSGNLALTLNSGSTEELYLFVAAAVSVSQGGQASASIDPYIYIDPSFADADQYSIELSAGVGTGRPAAAPPAGGDIPEPASLAILGAGLAGLRLIRRKKA